MYLFFLINKETNVIILSHPYLFSNKPDVYKYSEELLKDYPLTKYTYNLYNLTSSFNLFDDDTFLENYKLIYKNEHCKEPQLYPLIYVNGCCFEHSNILPSSNIKNLSFYSEFNIRRFLKDRSLSDIDMRRYHYSNCSIHHSDILVPLKSDKSLLHLFVCVKSLNHKQKILSICDDLTEAKNKLITSIIKNHDFYIENEKLTIIFPYYVYKIDKINEEYSKFNIHSKNWYDFINKLSLILTQNNKNIEDDLIIQDFIEKYKTYTEDDILPPIFKHELTRLYKLAIKE